MCDDGSLNGEHDHCANVRLHLFIIIKPAIPFNCIFYQLAAANVAKQTQRGSDVMHARFCALWITY